ncbi:asparagine synthetase B family protein [Micromonospora sp. LOL_021]|uniref:asparagine synthetase B family protein n=1 Tax=Micromonospora sp. LOL_021 TaxID=3345417 RepID=UPI003A8541AB
MSAIVGIVSEAGGRSQSADHLALACTPHDLQRTGRYLDDRAAIVACWFDGDRAATQSPYYAGRSPYYAATADAVAVSCTAQPDLLDLYRRHGTAAVPRLTGDFAIAVWDRDRNQLMLAADRTGERTLYWRLSGGRLTFASQLRALLADPRTSQELDPVALHHYLTYRYVPAPWTIYAGIRKLPPGTSLIWADGRVTTRRYWTLDGAAGPTTPGIDQAAEQLRGRLVDAVRSRLPATGSPQVLLSGGISATLVAAAVTRSTSVRAQTCSVGFGEPRLDQRAAARTVARALGTEHQEYLVTGLDPAVPQQIAGLFDEPFASPAAIPAYLVARYAGVRRAEAFCGLGGALLYGGFPHHLLLGWLNGWPQRSAGLPGLQRAGAALVRRSMAGTPVRRFGRLLEVAGCPPPTRYARIVAECSAEQKNALYTARLRDELADVDSGLLAEAAYLASSGDSQAARMTDADLLGYLPGDVLARWSTVSAGAGLRLQAPLLDHRLLEWVAGLPASWKVPGRRRNLARRAAAGWLPGRVVMSDPVDARPPLASWLRAELRELARDLLTDRTFQDRGLFQPAAVRRLLDEHQAGLDHAGEIYTLLQLELWLRHRTGSVRDPALAGQRDMTLEESGYGTTGAGGCPAPASPTGDLR